MVNSTLHIGGAEKVAACLAEHLSRERFQTTACYLKEAGNNAEHMLRAGVDLVPIPGLRHGHRDYLTFRKLDRLIRSRAIQVIHTHDLHGLMDGAACRILNRKLRFVHSFHFGNYPDRPFRYRMVERSLWRVPDTLVAVSHAQADAISDAYGIPRSRIRVIWNGVEEAATSGAPLPLIRAIPDGTPVIGSISTLIRQKGIPQLLDAAALLRDSGERFVLLIAGGGQLMADLKSQAARLDLHEHVQFLDWLPQASARMLSNCDIFVQSSLWEAMSIVVLEAMAAGRPMVVTAVGDNPRVVLHGQTGLVVPPADPVVLADALRKLLRDGELRSRLGKAARARYWERFTLQHMVDDHEMLYRELVNASS